MLQILLLEDERDDAELIEQVLARAGIAAVVTRTASEGAFLDALQNPADVILIDYSLPRYNGIAAVHAARQQRPRTPIVIVSGVIEEDLAAVVSVIGVSAVVPKRELHRLPAAVRHAVQGD